MFKEKVKILFVGLGGIGQRHLRNLYAKFGGNASFLAYRVRNLRKTVTPELTIDEGVDFIEKYAVRVFPDLDVALSERPDVAFICNPSSLHIEPALSAAEAGCDIFIEKPLSHTIDGVGNLISLCEAKNLVTSVGFQLRFHPCYALVKKLIKEGTIGGLLSVQAEVGEYLPGWHKYEDYREMYASKKDLGGGVILSQIHEIDYLYDLFGSPRRLFAFGGHLSNLEIDVEDVVDIIMEMGFNGKALPVSLHMDYVQRPPSRQCKIIGESGRITMDLAGLKVIVEKVGEEKELYDFADFERNQMFVNEIEHFFECIATRQPPLVTIKDGANSLRIAIAIKESIETREPIDL